MERLGRAYSFITIKAVSEEDRVIEGIASSPNADRIGDVVNPMGAKFVLPLPLLWQHEHDEPIGHVEMAKPTPDGIPFRARLVKADMPGMLMDRLDDAWQSIKLKLVQAVSIGFRPLKYSFMDSGGIEYDEWEWLELSCVTVPANADCTIMAVKSADHDFLRAAGIEDLEIPSPPEPAAIGKQARIVRLNDPAGVSAPPFIIRQIRRNPR